MTSQGKARICSQCGTVYIGYKTKCNQCLRVSRICKECGREFKSASNTVCPKCSASDRVCQICSRTFKGHANVCCTCRARERECTACGVIFIGARSKCNSCLYVIRNCQKCGKQFSSASNALCTSCRGGSVERVCAYCGCAYWSITNRMCHSCYMKSLPDKGQAINRASGNARRAREYRAEIFGPLSPSIYKRVMESGVCVYCGSHADTVDHVRPLSRMGIEHESNLVPACRVCNSRKRARLLTEWRDTERVTHALACSAKVRAEYARLTQAA